MADDRALNDTFAEIAVQRRAEWNSQLVQPQPEKHNAPQLPAMAPGRGPLPKRNRIDTPEKLARALDRSREKHAKFLVNHAPRLFTGRTAVSLEKFDWRLETAADRADFMTVLRGEGEWTPVTIPHYGPPEGRATAYYRTTFELTAAMLASGAIFLCFRGVDYKAHVFVNGALAGSHEGFFAPFEFDGTPYLRPGKNVLVVKVENDAIMMGNSSWAGPASGTAGDKLYAATGPGYDEPEVGWHHCPPGMGIYQPVCIEARARVHLTDIFVRPLPDTGGAEAWLEVFNCDPAARKVSVEFSVFGRNFKRVAIRREGWRPRTLRVPGLSDMTKPGDNEVAEIPAGAGVNYFKIPFDLPGFRWWTPETPWLYQIQVRLRDESGMQVDAAERQFGMRTFQIDETTEPKGTLRLNGQPIRLRGANTMGFEQQCVLRRQWDRLRDDILLAKLANMNFLRLTQRPVQEEVYDWCDRLGLMTQTDLPLFGCLRRNQFVEAIRQAGEMERFVRSHPCNILVSYINEPFPNADGNPFRHLTRPELTAFFRAADVVVRQANPERAIKPVDGDYDPPAPGLPDIHCYNGWYLSNGVDLGELHRGYWQRVKPGWNYACGEFGAEGLDAEATMRRHYPARWLPGDNGDAAHWTPARITKSQTAAFHYLWFEAPDSLAGWVERSQAHQAWITRLMTEAFRRDRRMVSFAVHLFIDAFPGGWMKAIMDVDRLPKPAYFAYREALTPLMVSPRTDRNAFFAGETALVEAWICNDHHAAPRALRLHYALAQGEQTLGAGETAVQAPAFDSALVGLIPVEIPAVAAVTPLTLRLALVDGAGHVVHDNEVALRAFPKLPVDESGSVRIVGRPDGPAARLARELGLTAAAEAATILIDDYGAYERAKAGLTRAVQAGAQAIFLSLPPGKYEIAGDRVEAQRGAMGARHFVARAAEHPLVGDLAPDDFKFWFNQAEDRPTPILASVFAAPRWRAILTSGNPDQTGKWTQRLAVAEKGQGRGRWCVCQLELAGRIAGNPVAEIFARRLLGRATAKAAGQRTAKVSAPSSSRASRSGQKAAAPALAS